MKTKPPKAEIAPHAPLNPPPVTSYQLPATRHPLLLRLFPCPSPLSKSKKSRSATSSGPLARRPCATRWRHSSPVSKKQNHQPPATRYPPLLQTSHSPPVTRYRIPREARNSGPCAMSRLMSSLARLLELSVAMELARVPC